MSGRNWIAAVVALGVVVGGTAQAQDPPNAGAAAKLLAASKLAAGGDGWNDIRTLHTVSRIEAAALAGRAESWTELLTGRFVDRYTLGPTSGAHGFDGSVGWIEDGEGQVRIDHTAGARQASVDESYRRSFAIWFPERHPAEILDGGMSTDLERRFRVIRVTPGGGRLLEMWFDATTFQLARVVEPRTGNTQTTYLSDYRPIGGIWLPYTARVSNGDRLFDQKIFVQTIEINVAIPPGAFAPPNPAPAKPPPD